MTIPDAIVLGPLALSVRMLVPVLSFALAALFGRILLRHEHELRRSVFDTLMNGVLLFFLGWKLAPVLGLLIRSPEHILADPMIALYLPGGRAGTGPLLLRGRKAARRGVRRRQDAPLGRGHG